MATAYELISSVTVSGAGAANIEFTSIPGSYTNLIVLASLRQGGSQTHGLTFNNDTSTANYVFRRLYGLGSGGAGSDQSSSSGNINPIGVNGSSQTANTFGNLIIYIPNYTSSNYKSVSCDAVDENNASGNAISALTAGIWNSTSAITSLKITPSTNYVQYSTAYLYGISNA